MDLYNIRPIEDSRVARDAHAHRAPQGSRSAANETSSVRGHSQASEPPQDDGAVAASPPERGQTEDPGQGPRPREREADRKQLLEAFAKRSNIPPETRLAIEVDVTLEETRFQILDKDTGEVLREVPEDEAVSLLRQLMKSGGLVDRQF